MLLPMPPRKGIVIAGGIGSRLYPVTMAVSKQLLPIYDKPMVYYPLSVLMLASIRDILIITTPYDLSSFKKLFGDGSQFGIKISYQAQPSPDGLAHAFILAEDFIGDDNVTLILGDNIFYGQNFRQQLNIAYERQIGATVFGHYVNDPERFGIVEFDDYRNILSIEEKPIKPRSHYAITGLYFYDNQVVEMAKQITPSVRKELEITDINNIYLKQQQLNVEILDRGFTWLDMGTHNSLIDASRFVQTMESQQGLKIACLEEIAFNNGWITADQLYERSQFLSKTNYGQYLLGIYDEYRKKNRL
jgi:glucose-1-phosphate thymidylyltransferase